jgi:hypothetical protein
MPRALYWFRWGAAFTWVTGVLLLMMLFYHQKLALQDPDGQWAGGAFFPGDFDFNGPEAAEGAGQPWTATTWSLNSLREWGGRRLRADGHGPAPRGEQPLGV